MDHCIDLIKRKIEAKQFNINFNISAIPGILYQKKALDAIIEYFPEAVYIISHTTKGQLLIGEPNFIIIWEMV